MCVLWLSRLMEQLGSYELGVTAKPGERGGGGEEGRYCTLAAKLPRAA